MIRSWCMASILKPRSVVLEVRSGKLVIEKEFDIRQLF